MGRRPHGSGSLITVTRADGRQTYYAKFRDPCGRQVKRRIGPVRSSHRPDGLTKSQAEARLRDLMQTTTATVPSDRTRTFGGTAEAWLTHLEATGVKASSVRAYRVALSKWFLPRLKARSLDRVTISDIEHAMKQMRTGGLSDKSIRNYVGVVRALFNFAMDKRRRWTSQNPADEIDLPRVPSYTEIRYLTTDEVWLLVDAARPGAYQALDRAMYLTAAMTGAHWGVTGSRLARRRLRPRADPGTAHLGPQGEGVHHAEVPPLRACHPDARCRRRPPGPALQGLGETGRWRSRVRRPLDRRAAGASPHV